jgi:predicted MFS family arabinose efflux permease
MARSHWQPYHTVWAILSLGWFATGTIRNALSPLLPAIRTEFALTFGQAGDLATAYFIAYAAVQFVGGYLGDRWGRKRVLVWGGALATLATLGTAGAWSPAALFAARLGVGTAHGMFFGSDRPLIAAHTPLARMGVGQGLSFAGLGFGVWFGTAAGGFLGGLLPWRGVFGVLAIFPAVAAALIALRITEPSRPARTQAAPLSVRPALVSGDLWLLYVAGLTPSFSQWVIGTWGPAILMEAGAGDMSRAAFYAGLFGLMAMPGLYFFGTLSDRLAARGLGRKFAAVGGYLALAADMGAIAFGISRGAPFWVLVPFVALVGALTWGPWAAIHALFSHVVPPRIHGVAFGLMNGCAMLGSVLGPPVAGRLRDAGGSFTSACLLAAGLAGLGALLVAAVRPAFRPGPEIVLGEKAPVRGGE